jgi:hypothetical protein
VYFVDESCPGVFVRFYVPLAAFKRISAPPPKLELQSAAFEHLAVGVMISKCIPLNVRMWKM